MARDFSLLDQIGAVWEQKPEATLAEIIKMIATQIKKVEDVDGVALSDEKLPELLLSLTDANLNKIYKKDLLEKYFKEKENGFIGDLSYKDYEQGFMDRGFEILSEEKGE